MGRLGRLRVQEVTSGPEASSGISTGVLGPDSSSKSQEPVAVFQSTRFAASKD